LLVGAIFVLYVWVASRQVRPRKLQVNDVETPRSPTSLRRKHSNSFSDIDQLDLTLYEEETARKRQDEIDFPEQIRTKCLIEEIKLMSETISKVSHSKNSKLIVYILIDQLVCFVGLFFP
jgi:hypothetical protein